jgi:hypothetical protein
MAEPQLVGSNPMFAIVDLAIRKEISWHEARARLRALLEEQPELFQAIEPEVLEDLVETE